MRRPIAAGPPAPERVRTLAALAAPTHVSIAGSALPAGVARGGVDELGRPVLLAKPGEPLHMLAPGDEAVVTVDLSCVRDLGGVTRPRGLLKVQGWARAVPEAEARTAAITIAERCPDEDLFTALERPGDPDVTAAAPRRRRLRRLPHPAGDRHPRRRGLQRGRARPVPARRRAAAPPRQQRAPGRAATGGGPAARPPGGRGVAVGARPLRGHLPRGHRPGRCGGPHADPRAVAVARGEPAHPRARPAPRAVRPVPGPGGRTRRRRGAAARPTPLSDASRALRAQRGASTASADSTWSMASRAQPAMPAAGPSTLRSIRRLRVARAVERL